jgi:hypothetical protein
MYFYTVHAFSSTEHSRLFIVSYVKFVENFVIWEERRLKVWSYLINGDVHREHSRD